MSNPKVFFDVSLDGKAAGRIVFEVRQIWLGPLGLFSPFNFVALCRCCPQDC